MDDYVVGIDLGATKIALGLIDPRGRIIASGRIPTNVADGPANAVERTAQSVAKLESELPADQKIAAMGICTPRTRNSFCHGCSRTPATRPKPFAPPAAWCRSPQR